MFIGLHTGKLSTLKNLEH